jgi:acyl-CoA synthetase (AMP-forming)/AMP-acid ligase II
MSDMDREYTWDEIDRLTTELAKDMIRNGVKKGTHVAIWASNSARWVITYFAIQRIGAVAILINIAYKWRELEKILLDYDVEYIYYTRSFKDSDHILTIQTLDRSRFPLLKKTFLMSDEVIDFEKESDNKDNNCYVTSENDVNENETCSILFTSGTTGFAKGVMLTHNNIVNNSKAIVDRMEWKSEDSICLTVPLFHCFGITAGIIVSLHTGAPMHIVRSFSTGTVFQVIEEKKCTVFNGVPTMFLAMMNSHKRERFDLSSLNGGLMAGSAILPAEYMKLCEVFGFTRLQTAFGQTESSPAITTSLISDSLEKKAYTSGKVLDNVEIRIWSEGKELKNGVEGEIQTRGYHVMKGYYKLPEETKNTVSEDGWLATGDLGYIDDEGYLHVTGRKKDIIIRGGENISPIEIENVITQLEGVKSVKVVGVKAEVIQEEVVACIIWKEGKEISEKEVKHYVKSQIADYKVPKYVLKFKEFPINSSGKILTKDLSEICYNIINKI